MHLVQLSHFLAAGLSVLYLAHASWLDANKVDIRSLAARQLGDLPDNPAADNSSTTPVSISSPSPSSTSIETPSPSSSSSSSSPESTSSEEQTTSSSSAQTTEDASTSSSSQPPSTSSPSEPESTSSSAQSSNGPSTVSSTSTSSSIQSSASPVVATTVLIVTRTNSDGSRTTMTSTSTSTSTPSLNSGGSSQSGMSTKTRNTVIGVVVGIGGAIVLGALGLVCWRIWGRKKNVDENDGLMDYDMGTGSMEKSEPGSTTGPSQRSPFQSTLENYHQPSAVNASSNF